MIIGTFEYDSRSDTYRGVVRTLTLNLPLTLKPASGTGERDPAYRAVSEEQGAPVEFGAAWARRSERGQDFLSVVLDDPALAKPVHAALFRSERDNSAALVWTRAKPAPAASAEPRRPEARPTNGRSRARAEARPR